jgi:hypothetical protein
VYRHKCKRCLGGWDTVLEWPKRCRLCGSPLWDKEAVRKPGGGRPKGSVGGGAIWKPGAEERVPVERKSLVEELREKMKAAEAGVGMKGEATGDPYWEEIDREWRRLIAVNPEADAGVMKGQAEKLVKQRRREAERS